MAIETFLRFLNPDSTEDINQRLAQLGRGLAAPDLLNAAAADSVTVAPGDLWPPAVVHDGQPTYNRGGVFLGGLLTTVGGGSSNQLIVRPFAALGADGLQARDTENNILDLPLPDSTTDREFLVVLRLEYVPQGTPIAEFQIVLKSNYESHGNQSAFIRFAGFTLVAGAGQITPADITYADRDVIDPMYRPQHRPPVQAVADLPTAEQGSKHLDVRTVAALRRQYIYDAALAIWLPLGATEDLENISAREAELLAQYMRTLEGSGLINGQLHSATNKYGTDRAPLNSDGSGLYIEAPIAGVPTLERTVRLNNMQFMVAGHFVQTRYQTLLMPVKPVSGPDRYDLVFLEVWREELTVPPDAFQHVANAAVSPVDWLEIQKLLETQREVNGNSLSDANADLNSIVWTADHKMVVTMWAFRVLENCGPNALIDALDIGGFLAVPQSGSGTPFATAAAGDSDTRLWHATNPSAYDESTGTGKISWGMPIAVVRRTNDENHAINNAIREFRVDDDQRYITSVAPWCDTSFWSKLRLVRETLAWRHAHDDQVYPLCSGALDNHKSPLRTVSGDTELAVDNGQFHIHGHRFRFDDSILLPDPPAAGLRRDMVVLTLRYVMYPDHTGTRISEYTAINGDGDRTMRVIQPVFRLELFEAASSATVEAAMGLGGYSRPYAEDPGLWSRSSTVLPPVTHQYYANGTLQAVNDVDDPRVNIDGVVYAIPIALVHRRNTQPWLLATNQNGDAGRPDGLTAAAINLSTDVLDARHLVGDDLDLGAITDATINALCNGSLRQRMAVNAHGAGGVQLDKTDYLGAPVAGTDEILPAPDNDRSLWSEAVEIMPITAWAPGPGGGTPVIWWALGPPDTVTIDVSGMIGVYILTEGDEGSAEFGPVSPVGELEVVPATFVSTPLIRSSNWTVLAKDGDGRPTIMSAAFSPTGPLDDLYFSYLAVSDHVTAPYVLDTDYAPSSNRGLSRVPDYVYKAYYGGTNDLAIRRLSTRVTAPTAVGGIITILAADIQLLLGLVNPPTLLHAHVLTVEDNDGSTAHVTYSEVNAAGNTITIQLAGTGALDGKNVELEVSWQNADYDRWIHVLPGSRGLQAYLGYRNIDATPPGAHPPIETYLVGGTRGHLANDLGNPQCSGLVAIYQRAGAGPWILRRPSHFNEFYKSGPYTARDGLRGWYGNSLIVEWDPAQNPASDEMRFVCITCTPPVAGGADDIKLHYKYTPYQGLTEQWSTAADKRANLRNISHGHVLDVGDVHVTTRGVGTSLLGKTPSALATGTYNPNVRTLELSTGLNERGRYLLNPDSVARALVAAEDGGYGRFGIVKGVWRALTERLPWYTDFISADQVLPGRVYPHEVANRRIGLAALDLLGAMMAFSTGAWEGALLPISSVEGSATNHLVLPVAPGQQPGGGVSASLYGGELYQAGVSPIATLDFVGYTAQQKLNVANVLTAEARQFHVGMRGLWSGRDIGAPGQKVLGGTILFLVGQEPTFVERWQAEQLITTVSDPEYIDLPAYKQALGNRDNLVAVSQDPTGYLSFAGVLIQAMRAATLSGGTNPFGGYLFLKIGTGMNRLQPMQSTKISIGYAHDAVWPLYRPLVKPRES